MPEKENNRIARRRDDRIGTVMSMNSLEKARNTIDKIDEQLASLFEARMKLTEIVAAYKKKHDMAVFDESREAQVLEKAKQRISKPDLKGDFAQWMQTLMDLSKKQQRQMLNANKVAYCGVEGAFACSATRTLFPQAEAVSCASFADVFKKVQENEVRYGVVPLENSNSGLVGEVLDLLFESGLYIVEAADIRIRQCLLGVKGAQLKEVCWVYSKDQALWQSKTFLDALGVETICYPNTAMAAQYVAQQADPAKAAIGARDNASLYDLDILAENIEGSASNTTRFLVISAVPNAQENEVSSLLLTVPDSAGALAKAINVIAAFDLNMDNLQSRPVKSRPFEYYFFVQLAGHTSRQNVEACLQALSAVCTSVRSLGSYSIRKDDQL